MRTRSSDNWNFKAGGLNKLNIDIIEISDNYPTINCKEINTEAKGVWCNYATQIDLQNRFVNMFVDDYILERYWNDPKRYVSIFNKAEYVMSPDYSLLIGMPEVMQMWQVYRNRAVGYYWQSKGINVVPTISWSDRNSFNFAFKWINKGSIVAVSNIGCRNEEQLINFTEGYNEMIKQIQPNKIIFQCSKKYRQMFNANNVIFIDSYWDNKRKWEEEVVNQ